MTMEGRLAQLLAMLQDEPGDVFLNYALALEYQKLGDGASSHKQLQKVLALDPDYVAAYFQLGRLCETQNDTGLALHYYREGRKRALAKNDRRAAGEFEEAIFLLED